MRGYRAFVRGREFVVFAVNQHAAGRIVWIHYQLLTLNR